MASVRRRAQISKQCIQEISISGSMKSK